MLRNSSFDPEQISTTKFRKRLFSEHQEDSNEKKRTKKGNCDTIQTLFISPAKVLT